MIASGKLNEVVQSPTPRRNAPTGRRRSAVGAIGIDQSVKMKTSVEGSRRSGGKSGKLNDSAELAVCEVASSESPAFQSDLGQKKPREEMRSREKKCLYFAATSLLQILLEVSPNQENLLKLKAELDFYWGIGLLKKIDFRQIKPHFDLLHTAGDLIKSSFDFRCC